MTSTAIRVVSWDVDGTLYSLRAMRWRLAWMVAGETMRGGGRAARAELTALLRRRARIEKARSVRRHGLLDAELQADCLDDRSLATERRWVGAAIARAGARAGVHDLLNLLVERGIPSIVISDYTADYKLDALRLRDRFTSIYEGVRHGCVKPSPRLFQRSAEELDVPTSSILHIGDRTETDGTGARAAGCQVRILGRDFRTMRELIREFRPARSGDRAGET